MQICTLFLNFPINSGKKYEFSVNSGKSHKFLTSNL